MRITYDPEAEALGLWLAAGATTIGAKEIAPPTRTATLSAWQAG
jgi:hypothetical protein